jgi:hypothetical protein
LIGAICLLEVVTAERVTELILTRRNTRRQLGGPLFGAMTNFL